MKSRVVENLSQFANETPSEKSKDMLHIIAEELGMAPPEIQQKAKLILKQYMTQRRKLKRRLKIYTLIRMARYKALFFDQKL